MKKTLMVILTVLALLPAAASAFELWIINPRGGIAFPLGQLGDNTSLSWNAGVSARKGFDREIAAGGSISFATMPYKVTSAPEPFACTILNAEFTFTPYLPDLFVWPYLKVGAGVFLVKYAAVTGTYPDYSTVMQDETAFGIILGGGVNYPVTNEIAANLEILYNQASVQGGQGDNYNFLTFNLGATIFIK